MIVEKIKTEGIAHLSYMVIDNGEAAVIDPRRDIEVYLGQARRHGAQIRHIFETHRNEDYVVGSKALADSTGASVHHGRQLPVAHAAPTAEGDRFDIGDASLTVLETPGHTKDSISLALADRTFADEPVAVFTGDTLFIGDVGRTDFYPDEREAMSAALYDSIFDKLLPLGDGVLLYPAHGAGSVCGSGMAEREFSTLGYERQHNPVLQLDRDAFVRAKTQEHHYQPFYFEKMEVANSQGLAHTPLPDPVPMNPAQWSEAMANGMRVIDLRDAEGFCGAHIPGSLSMPKDLVAGYGGWLIEYGRPLGLVLDDPRGLDEAVRTFFRMGYDDIQAYLYPGMTAWEASGEAYATMPTVSAQTLKRYLEENRDFVLLDVRTADEYAEGRLPGATHVYLGHLPEKLDTLPSDKPIVTFCGSGKRAAVAASLLSDAGFADVSNCLGSMAACQNIGCEIVTS